MCVQNIMYFTVGGQTIAGAKRLGTAIQRMRYFTSKISRKKHCTVYTMSLSNQSEQSDWKGPSSSKRSKLERTVDDDCSYCQTNMASELDERIFTYVSDSDTFDFAKFGFLKLGPLCNASESCSFTEATCNFKTVRNENNLALILEFSQLFSRGITLLNDVKNNKRELEQHELVAIKLLDSFFKDKGM